MPLYRFGMILKYLAVQGCVNQWITKLSASVLPQRINCQRKMKLMLMRTVDKNQFTVEPRYNEALGMTNPGGEGVLPYIAYTGMRQVPIRVCAPNGVVNLERGIHFRGVF